MKKTKTGFEERFFQTRDGLTVVANFFPGKKSTRRLLVLAPGFAKFKDAYPMTDICRELTKYGDVLCLDFRGVGKSEGRYSFGGSEYLDLEPLLKWGQPYQERILVGLSLGSYHSLRAAHAWPHLVSKVFLVSCPTRLEDVLLTLGPIRQGFAIAIDWKALKKRLGIEFNLFFRWGNPFSKKPNGTDLAKRLKVPLFFLVGGKDRLVVKSLSRKIYEQASNPKSWTEIPKGNHAEFLYLENQPEFNYWFKRSLA
jgi:pimeloyl-ACP methyl ester carboxylesterase